MEEEFRLNSQQAFQRKSTKFLVPISGVDEVEAIILQHLPKVPLNNKTNYGGDSDSLQCHRSSLVSSVYFDNKDLHMPLFSSRVRKDEGATLIRLRWYGEGRRNKAVFVERKTHHESWVLGRSSKARFQAIGNVGKYIKGDSEVVKNLPEPAQPLALGIQKLICEKNLKPVIRTQYERRAFGDPEDLRVTLDFNLQVGSEDGDWDELFERIEDMPADRQNFFPFVIMETKEAMTSKSSTEIPWVLQMQKQGLCRRCSFSKYGYGCLELLLSYVQYIPWWYTQLKDGSLLESDYSIKERPSTNEFSSASSDSMLAIEGDSYSKFAGNLTEPIKELPQHEVDLNSVGINPKSLQYVMNAKSDDSVANVSLNNDQHVAIYLENLPDSTTLSSGGTSLSKVSMNIHSELPLHSGKKKKRRSLSRALFQRGTRFSFPSNERQLKQTVYHDIMKVEPKTYFANERTFLNWMNIAITMALLTTSLISFGGNDGKLIGYVFLPISIILMLYGLIIFYWRANRIALRKSGPYDDRLGPLLLVAFVSSALIVVFILRIRNSNEVVFINP